MMDRDAASTPEEAPTWRRSAAPPLPEAPVCGPRVFDNAQFAPPKPPNIHSYGALTAFLLPRFGIRFKSS
jgi:hypothetical protein